MQMKSAELGGTSVKPGLHSQRWVLLPAWKRQTPLAGQMVWLVASLHGLVQSDLAVAPTRFVVVSGGHGRQLDCCPFGCQTTNQDNVELIS